MPLTKDQARLLVPLLIACRPIGAPVWDEQGVMAALSRVANRNIAEVIIAATRAAADREAKTPGVIPTNGPHWSSDAIPSAAKTANHPPKRDETCPHHPAYRATNCGGCLADQRAADGGDTPPRAWEPAESNAAALARAAYAQSRAQLCAHGVPRLNCADHRDTHPTEETRP
jgi:hypothetical protein